VPVDAVEGGISDYTLWLGPLGSVMV
jgi:hypothetical protein